MVLIVVGDVPFEIETEFSPREGVTVGQTGHKLSKHARNHVFAAVGESSHNRRRRFCGDHLKRPLHKLGRSARDACGIQRLVEGESVAKQFEQPFHGRCVGSGSPHGLEIQLKVRSVPPIREGVGLLVEHNLVDQPAGLGIGGREPGNARAGKPLLDRFQQALEVPYRVDVELHEPTQFVGRVDCVVEAVSEQPVTGVAEVDGELKRGL